MATSQALTAMLHSGFDYYEPMKLQTSIEQQMSVEVSPINALQPNTPFEFFVMGGEGESLYIDLASSYFVFKVRIQTDANANPDAAAEISCIQNLAHSMFQRIELYANDKLINDPNGLYPYRAYFAELFSRGSDSQKSWMALQGWTKRDIAASMDGYRTTTGGKNDTAVVRNTLMGKGESQFLVMKPHLELFNCDKFIPPGIKIRVKFTPAPNNFVLKRGTGATVNKLEFQDAKFYCQYVKATHVQDLSLIEAMKEVGPIRLNMNRVMLKHMTIPAGNTTANLDNIYFGPIPNRIIVGMVLDTAIAGHLEQNPFNFQHFNSNFLSLYVNGKMVPNPPYQPNWETGEYKREYFGTIQALNKSFSEYPFTVSTDEFKQGYTVFAFDLTADHNSQTSLSDQGNGTVRIILRFGQALTAAITVLLHAEYDAYIEIDQYKHITANF